MQIRPIRTPADHRAALEEIERLMNAQLDTADGDRLDVLVTLVDDYEARHEPIEPPAAIDALQYHMESRGLTRRDLEPMIGSRARVAEVLNRRRALTIEMDSSTSCRTRHLGRRPDSPLEDPFVGGVK